MRALVLGGGGVAGVAWETGVLLGLADGGVDVTDADLVLGTSAGSVVGAQLTAGLPLTEMYERQVDPARQTTELNPTWVSVPEVIETWTKLPAEYPDPARLRRRIGELALAAETVPESERLAVIAARVPGDAWPEDRAFSVVAVDAYTGEPRVFARESGVGLVEAVAASCAVPFVWPPVTIGDSRYVDGGIRSGTNADLANGYDQVLILAPMTLGPALDEEVAELRRNGSRVEVIMPSEEAVTAFGTNPLDPATRTPSAHAGRAQAADLAGIVSALWRSA